MKKKVIVGIAKLLGLIAIVNVSTACLYLFHRPEIPAELKRS